MTNEKTENRRSIPRSIAILEELEQSFLEAAKDCVEAVTHTFTRSEIERTAVEMQRYGRGEAWRAAAAKVREVLGRKREWLEQDARMLEQLDEKRADLERVQTAVSQARMERDRAFNALGASQYNLEEVSRERDRFRNENATLDRAWREAEKALAEMTAARDGLAKQFAEAGRKNLASGKAEIAARIERDAALEQASAHRLDAERATETARAWKEKADAYRLENERLQRLCLAPPLACTPLLEIGRELRRREKHRSGPLSTADAAKLKCAAILVLEVAHGPGLAAARELAKGEDVTDRFDASTCFYTVDRGEGRPKFTRIEPVMLSVAAQRAIARARVDLGEIDRSMVWDASVLRGVLTRLLDALPSAGALSGFAGRLKSIIERFRLRRAEIEAQAKVVGDAQIEAYGTGCREAIWEQAEQIVREELSR